MKLIRKLFYTTLTTFTILTIYTISSIEDNTLRTNLELEDITNIKTNTVYLLNNNNYLEKVDIFIEKSDVKNQVINIINYLKESNNKIQSNYNGYVPKNTNILDISIKNNILYLNLSKEFLKEDFNITITGLIKSLLEIKGIDKVELKVEGNYVEGYNKVFDKSLAINKKYELQNRNNINKVVVYYMSKDNNYIPVTKYVNDKREKVEIIIDELKNNNDSNLISYLNSNTKLINYKEENNIIFLNFNKYLIDDINSKEKIINQIAYSVFDNYDIESVIFEIEEKNINIINKS